LQSYELYGGAVTLTFDVDSHIYTVNGKIVPDSISGCLKVINKPALIGWAAGLAVDHIQAKLYPGLVLDEVNIKELLKGSKTAYRAKTEKAANIGTLGHLWAEDYLNGKNPPLPVNIELRNIAETFLKFLHENNVEVISAEQKVYSRELNVAGTFDALARFNGELAILDWKTGSGIYPEYFLQMGGYDLCHSEEYSLWPESGNQIKQHIIVNCSKTGELKVAISDKVMRNREGFRNALFLSRILSNIEKELKEL
jgi:hypothetical protein